MVAALALAARHWLALSVPTNTVNGSTSVSNEASNLSHARFGFALAMVRYAATTFARLAQSGLHPMIALASSFIVRVVAQAVLLSVVSATATVAAA